MANDQVGTVHPSSLMGEDPLASTHLAHGGMSAGEEPRALAPAWHSQDWCIRALLPCSSPCFLGRGFQNNHLVMSFQTYISSETKVKEEESCKSMFWDRPRICAETASGEPVSQLSPAAQEMCWGKYLILLGEWQLVGQKLKLWQFPFPMASCHVEMLCILGESLGSLHPLAAVGQ